MKILLTGAGGQLGQAFLEVVGPKHQVIPAYHSDPPRPDGIRLDLLDLPAIRDAVLRVKPDWIVHGAAMTNVDACERDPALAHRVNAEATGALAAAAAEASARMVYVSTDYVFDGEKGNYREDDPVHAISHYGASKLEGERMAAAALPDVVIARTSVVYGPHKNNFVLWLIGELRAGRHVKIVKDQIVTPTLTYDLAEQLLALVQITAKGLYHTAGATRLSRLEMAREIAGVYELDASLVDPITSDQLMWVAKRPRDSSLDTTKIGRLKRPLTLRKALKRMRRHR